MGLIISRFREKPSTRDTLERIEQELQNIEERRWDKIKREQFVIQILSFIPVTILIATVCFLIYPTSTSWRDKLLLCVPVIILNLVIWTCRKIVQWYSRWSLDNEEASLRKLRKEKRRILEMVCETESYRVAAELLEKYDPKQLRRRERGPERPTSPVNTTLTKISASPIRPANNYQNFPSSFQSQPTVPAPPPPTPITKPASKAGTVNTTVSSFPITSTTVTHPVQLNATISNPHNTSITSPIVAASSVQGRPVRPILSKERTIFEKLVDWVVSDGPDNRFALICRYCYGHNGMSLAEEYETINFRCCYCYNLNTATNKRHQLYDQLHSGREKKSETNEEGKKIGDNYENENVRNDANEDSEDLVQDENKEETVEEKEEKDDSSNQTMIRETKEDT